MYREKMRCSFLFSLSLARSRYSQMISGVLAFGRVGKAWN